MGEKAKDVNAFCTQCGVSNPGYEIFCGNCGTTLEKQTMQTPPKQIYTESTQATNRYDRPPQSHSSPRPPNFQQPYPGNYMYNQQSHPVRWQDATKITVGVLLIIAGISLGLFGFVVLFISPALGLILLILVSVLPIYAGYILLKRFMGGWDMIKASITTYLAGLLVYLYGVIVFFIMIFFLFAGYFF